MPTTPSQPTRRFGPCLPGLPWPHQHWTRVPAYGLGAPIPLVSTLLSDCPRILPPPQRTGSMLGGPSALLPIATPVSSTPAALTSSSLNRGAAQETNKLVNNTLCSEMPGLPGGEGGSHAARGAQQDDSRRRGLSWRSLSEAVPAPGRWLAGTVLGSGLRRLFCAACIPGAGRTAGVHLRPRAGPEEHVLQSRMQDGACLCRWLCSLAAPKVEHQ